MKLAGTMSSRISSRLQWAIPGIVLLFGSVPVAINLVKFIHGPPEAAAFIIII